MLAENTPDVYTPTEEMQAWVEPVQVDRRRRDYLITLEVGVLMLICVAAIAAGYYISARATNEGIPILAALGCAVLINWLLGPKGE